MRVQSRSSGFLLVLALAACGAESGPVQLDTGDPCAVVEPIGPGDTIQSRLSRSDCLIGDDRLGEYWGLTLGGPMTQRIEAWSPTILVFPELRTSDGTLIAAPDSPGGDDPAVIEESLDAGSYVVVVSSWYPGGTYYLTVTAVGGS